MRYLYSRRIPLFFIIAAIVLAIRLFSGCGEGLNILTEDIPVNTVAPVDPPPPPPPPPVDPWTEFSYRRSVTVSNSGTEQTDYQVNIILSSSNFSFSNADVSGNDIRFNYKDTSLPYWIENWNSATESASVWVKMPSIANSETVIYLYYGKTGQASESDFDNTFTKDSGFSGLVARWHMDEGTGTVIDDSSSNTNDGTITNAIWAHADGGRWYTSTTAGFSTGDSLSFDGTGDYVTVPDNNIFGLKDLTIALWFKADSTPVATKQYLVSKWLSTGNMRSYTLYLLGNVVTFETSYNGSASHILSSTSVSSGTWYHVAATFDDATLTKVIYLNGSSGGTNTATDHLLKVSTTSLTIGVENTTTLADYFGGIIDEVAIYDRALSSDEIKALSRRSKYSSAVGTPSVGSEELVP